MSTKHQSRRACVALVPASQKEVMTSSASSLHRMRSAIAFSEDEDARMTGMTRSLDRRLLALNLEPVPPASAFGYLKVA